MSHLIEKVIKGIPSNVYGDEQFNYVNQLSDDEKHIIMNNMTLLRNLLLYVIIRIEYDC